MPQTENIPTITPPPAPPNGSGQGDHRPSRGPRTPTEWERYSKRILGWAFLASIFINLGFGIWLGYTDIYGTQRTKEEQKRVKIQVYRPPIKHPRKPKPPPPPPKPKIKPPPPKIVRHVTLKPPPRIIPKVQPPPPRPVETRAPVVGHTVHTNNPTAVNTGPVSQAPVEAVPQNPGTNTAPTAPVQAPPVQQPKPQPPPPPPVEQPKPQPPPPPVEQPKPKPPAIPDRNTPEVEGSFRDINLDGIDMSDVNVSSVDVTWQVDARGHVSNIHFHPTGNSEVDEAIRKAINESHYTPAVHNGQVVAGTMAHTFELSN